MEPKPRATASQGGAVISITASADPYDPAADAKRMAPEAGALARILVSAPVTETLARYAAADAQALAAQARFTRLSRWEVRGATVAALIGAAFLSPLGDQFEGPARAAGVVIQYAALLLSIGLGLWGSRVGALDTWRNARSEAEKERTALFRGILAAVEPARDGELPAPPLQVEYFVKGLLEPQLGYFQAKTAQHRERLSRASRWRWLGYLAFTAIAVIGALSALRWLAPTLGLTLWPWLQVLADHVLPLDHPRVLLAIGVVASTLQGIATMRAQTFLSERNAERFAIVGRRLREWQNNKLSTARSAAGSGDRSELLALCEEVFSELEAEARAWQDVRGSVRPKGNVRLFKRNAGSP